MNLQKTNPHWPESELRALLERKLIFTTFKDRQANTSHLTAKEQQTANKGLETELALVTEAEGMIEVLVALAAQYFMSITLPLQPVRPSTAI